MEIDFAILYFGLTRSAKNIYESHINHLYKVLERNKLTYKKFMHTWGTRDGTQNIWENIIPQKIDYSEYKLLNPDFYKIDNEEEFLQSINMDDFFYKDIWDTIGHSTNGEWLPKMVSNHLCMLESQKRGIEMIEDYVLTSGIKPKYIIFIRPDVKINNDLPLVEIVLNENTINLPNHSHHEGLNDQFAVLNYKYANIYGKRINEIANFRKTHGRIVGEKYVKYIIMKYNLHVKFINFSYVITRP